jgi:hypothetical protein
MDRSVRHSLSHLLVLSTSQDVKFEFLVKSRVDEVKEAMNYSMKSENKLDGASNFRAWKTRIDLILSKNKVMDIVKGKIVKLDFEEGKEKEPQNVAPPSLIYQGIGTHGFVSSKVEHWVLGSLRPDGQSTH